MAKGSGRRSLADLNAAEFIAPIQPIRRLTKQEKAVWNRIMASWPGDHWVTSDAELLTQYCAISVHADRFMKAGDMQNADRLGKLMLSFARSLRITPQSRYDARGADREATRGREVEAASSSLLGGGAWKPAVPN